MDDAVYVSAAPTGPLASRLAWVVSSHAYQGLCPDSVEGWDVRDPACVACFILDKMLVTADPLHARVQLAIPWDDFSASEADFTLRVAQAAVFDDETAEVFVQMLEHCAYSSEHAVARKYLDSVDEVLSRVQALSSAVAARAVNLPSLFLLTAPAI